MTTEPAHLRPSRTDRGFAHLPTIDGHLRGEQVKVYESSAAIQPRVWLRVMAPKDRNHPDTSDLNDAVVELDMYAVRDLRDQLNWMLTNHYHLGSRPDGTKETFEDITTQLPDTAAMRSVDAFLEDPSSGRRRQRPDRRDSAR